MRAIDAAAIDMLGIPRLLLMEHAGVAVARAARELRPPPAVVVACCGAGFNGGDGLAAARHLTSWGYRVSVILTGAMDSLAGEPAVFARILARQRVPFIDAARQPGEASTQVAAAVMLLDALVGVGLRGPIREPALTLIQHMNAAAVPIIAADVPSGLDGDDGSVHGLAVRATVTVSFGMAKQGCARGQGPAHAGRLLVDDISLPPELLTS